MQLLLRVPDSDAFAATGSARDVASDEEAQIWERMMSTPDLTVYVAETNGVAVGTATLLIMPNLAYSGPTAFIEAVVVVARHRRRGVATSMLNYIPDDARSAGCNKVQLLSQAACDRRRSPGVRGLSFEPEAEGFRVYLKDVPKSVQSAKAK